MAPRANWKGFLRLSLVTCPVALFPATSESEKISFNQINRNTGHRIKYTKVDARQLEREAGRNLEVMWLTGRLAPDHKTIADFRKDNGPAIKKVCAQFVELCRKMGLLAKASVAIDGSKFKAVNSRDNNFTQGKIQRRQKQIEESVARYMSQLDTADRQTAAGEEA